MPITPALKEARLAELARFEAFSFRKLDLKDREGVAALFGEGKFTRVVHPAAQAGVRHSLEAPHDYVDSNITRFLNVLEGCRHVGTEHLLYASSSSVYV
jgi:UDP-glucuronate 4-epimerase